MLYLGRNDRATYTLFSLATNSNTLLHPRLHPITEQKDLGVWTTPSMNFSVHCQRNFKYMSNSSLMIYKTFVRPHLEFCAPIWNPPTIVKTSTHLKRCREEPPNLFHLSLHLTKSITSTFHILQTAKKRFN